MDDLLINKVELAVGLKLEGERLVSALDDVEPHTYEFRFPSLAPVRSLSIKPVSTGQVIDIHQRALRKAAIGTPAYRKASYLAHLQLRSSPVLDEGQLDELALADYDGLYTFLSSGRDFSGESAYRFEGENAMTEAWVRLPTRSDHKMAESDAGGSSQRNPYEYQLWLLWHCARFGQLTEDRFDARPGYDVGVLRQLIWPDFTTLVGAAMSDEPEDFKLLSSVLEGMVRGADGYSAPFPDIPEESTPGGSGGGSREVVDA